MDLKLSGFVFRDMDEEEIYKTKYSTLLKAVG